MRSLFIYIYLAFTFTLAIAKVNNNAPYPKVEKQFKSGQYDKCLETINNYLGKASTEKIIWLYWMQSRCHLMNAQIEPSKLTHLKKAFASFDKMARKNKGQVAEYAKKSMSEFTNVLAATEKKLKSLPPKENQYFNESLAFYKKYWKDEKAVLFIFDHQKNIEDPTALSYLESAVIENYQGRKKGDTVSMLNAYLRLLEFHADEGMVKSAMSVHIKSLEVYPSSEAVICTAGEKAFLSGLSTFSNINHSARNILSDWADTMASLTCKNKAPGTALLTQEFTWNCQTEPSFRNALQSAIVLKNRHDSFSSNWFLARFKHSLSGFMGKPDSIRLAVFFEMAEIKTANAKAIKIEEIINQFVADYKPNEALALFRFAEKNYAGQKVVLDRIRKVFNSKLMADIASSQKNKSLGAILQYHELNIGTPNIKDITIKQLITLNSEMISAGNFSQSMRITKAGLNLFPGDNRLLSAKKAWMQADYQENYEKLKSNFGMEIRNANGDKCQEGYVTQESQQKFFKVLNLVRRFSGIYDSCTLDEETSKKCQKAAMMMSENYLLTHSPEKTLKCFTTDGRTAAGCSNLSLGHNGIYALFGQLGDDGANNTEAGHRRWILNPRSTQFAHGSYGSSMALGVFALKSSRITPAPVFDYEKDFISWPSADFFPADWDIYRWSFSKDQANFKEAQVTVKQNGKVLTVKVHSEAKGYGINTLVWDIQDKYSTQMPVDVKVEKVKIYDSKTSTYVYKSYSYTVTFF
jgi:hypothetical protein